MNEVTHRMGRVGMVLAIIAATASHVPGQHQHAAPRVLPPRAAAPRPAQPNPPQIDVRQVAALQEAVARALGHVQAGRQPEAVKELQQLQASLESLRQAVDKNAAAAFVNSRCPMMGSPIDPTRVPAALMRVHEGRKVAFCCAGCPQAWDQLSGAEKTAKLASVTASAPQAAGAQGATGQTQPQGMSHRH